MPTPEEKRLDALTEVQDAEVLRAEEEAAAEATAGLRDDLATVTATALAAWAALDEDDRAETVRRIRLRLRRVPVAVAAPLRRHMVDALALGGRQAARQLANRRVRVRVTGLPTEIEEMLDALDDRVRSDLDAADRLITIARDRADVQAAMGRANRAVTRTREAATWGVNRAVAHAVTEVAERVGTKRLWIGERDACLHCLAYFGEVADPESPFPSGLTFGDRPLKGPVPAPPLHPNCRCRIVLWLDDWGSERGTTFPEALKREARRSVARGWSLPSESNASRLRAAERLLRRGAGLPRTVEDYARRAVRTGRFPRGRTFPG